MGAYVVDCGGAMNFYTKKPRIRTVSVRLHCRVDISRT